MHFVKNDSDADIEQGHRHPKKRSCSYLRVPITSAAKNTEVDPGPATTTRAQSTATKLGSALEPFRGGAERKKVPPKCRQAR